MPCVMVGSVLANGQGWGPLLQHGPGCTLLFVNCSLAASWTTWKRFWMICRTVSYHSFSQTQGQELLLGQLTSKPSSMTSCNSQLTAVPSHLPEPRRQHCACHRALLITHDQGNWAGYCQTRTYHLTSLCKAQLVLDLSHQSETVAPTQ